MVGQHNAYMLMALRTCARLRGATLPQMQLVIIGPAGHGKTVVIKAVTELHQRLGVGHWVRCAALQGGVAHAIDGRTWHSLLGIGIGVREKANRRLVTDIFDDSRLLITDEFSMISKSFFARISKGLGGKGGVPFRGLDTVWCGDFAQLGPVGGG